MRRFNIRTSPAEMHEFRRNLQAVRDYPDSAGIQDHILTQIASRLTWPKPIIERKERLSKIPLPTSRERSQTLKGTSRLDDQEPIGTFPDMPTVEETKAVGGSRLRRSSSLKGTRSYILDSDGKRPLTGGSAVPGGQALTTTSSQLNAIIKPLVPGFQGCFAIDQLDDVEFSDTADTSFILNSDPSSKPGQHWIGVWVSPVKSHTIEVFDSLADKDPEKNASPLQGPKLALVKKKLTEKGKYLELPYPLKFRTNQTRDQRANSSSCGWFATRFILERAHGESWAQATKFDGIEKAEMTLKKLEAEYI
jgi:hypothetical protein